MIASSAIADRLRALREQFDHSFAAADAATDTEQVDLLAIRIAGDRYALRLSEVASLHADRRLVAAPSLLPELLGIAGFRGVLTPVYSLGGLLGYPIEGTKKWLIVARWAAPIAFAFDLFDAHLRVPVDRVSLANGEPGAAVCGAVHAAPSALPLLHLPSLVEGILRRVKDIKASGPSQER